RGLETDLKIARASIRGHPLVAVRMPLSSGDGPGPQDEHPARLDHLRNPKAIDVKRYCFPGKPGARIGSQLRAYCLDCPFYPFDCLIPLEQAVQLLEYREFIRTRHR